MRTFIASVAGLVVLSSRKCRTVVMPTLVCLGMLWPCTAVAQNVPFKVYITELVQLDSGVVPIGSLGDYYAVVTINRVAQNSPACGDDPNPRSK